MRRKYWKLYLGGLSDLLATIHNPDLAWNRHTSLAFNYKESIKQWKPPNSKSLNTLGFFIVTQAL
jgi:hypothetical protein